MLTKLLNPKTYVPPLNVQQAKKKVLEIVDEDGYLKEVSFSDIQNLPTTLSGYGITDAYISGSTITLGSTSITPLTSFTETDPIFSASAAAGITSSDITNWNTAYGWGDHSAAGYLTSIPIAGANTLGGIKVGNNLSIDANGVLSASGGGGGSTAWIDITGKPTTLGGYGITDANINNGTITLGSNTITPLTSFTETDPIFSASAAAGISSSDITSWNGKYTKPVGGIPGTDLADTYLTSYTETDPTVPNWAKAANKPSYNFSEIGSTPTTLSGYGITDAKIQSGTITLGSNTITPLTSFTETDPTVPSWAKASSKPSYSLTEISGTTDLQLIEALTGEGLLKRNSNNTWSLDTNSYLTSYTETDPVFSASAAAGISSSDISTWNAKQKAITISSSEPTSGDGSNGDIWIVI